jgi:hypothetical protein
MRRDWDVEVILEFFDIAIRRQQFQSACPFIFIAPTRPPFWF